jgi:dihydropyrimidinase
MRCGTASRMAVSTWSQHTSDYTPYEGLEVTGAVRSVLVRARPVVRDCTFVGQRGFGTFVDRGPAGA